MEIKSKRFNYLQVIFFICMSSYFFYLTKIASAWRLDTLHDGYTYVSAILGIDHIYPPQTANHHGIVAPFIESKILRFFSPTLLTYRFISLALIWLTAITIFKIISLKVSKQSSAIFSLLWISANPVWSYQTTGQFRLQPTYPNLWIQFFTLVAIFLVLRKNTVNYLDQFLVGIIFSTLPLIRIQGLFYAILVYLALIYKNKKNSIMFTTGAILSLSVWLYLIQINGGLINYLKNIVINPSSLENYSEYRSVGAIISIFASRSKYYVVIILLFLLFAYLFSKPQTGTTRFKNRSVKIIILLILIGSLIKNNLSNWILSLLNNLTFLLIDFSFPVATILIFMFIFKLVLKGKLAAQKMDLRLYFFALFVLASVGFQFPLADTQHKWWSTAASSIFLAHLTESRHLHEFDGWLNVRLRNVLVSTSFLSIALSAFLSLFFLSQHSQTIKDEEIKNFNGIHYSIQERANIHDFFLSLKVLSRIEAKVIKINYVCPEPLYYLRQNGYAKEAINSLNLDVQFDYTAPINFICNESKIKSQVIQGYKKVIIGTSTKNVLFIKNSEINLFNWIQKWMLQFN